MEALGQQKSAVVEPTSAGPDAFQNSNPISGLDGAREKAGGFESVTWRLAKPRMWFAGQLPWSSPDHGPLGSWAEAVKLTACT